MIEEDSRFRHLEKKIGLFAAVAIAGLIVVVLLIGAEKDIFTPKYTLRFTVEKGTGFSRGMPVKLSGFRIGRVKSIALNARAMVDIEIEIDRKYQKWIKDDSNARLVKEGLVGDNIIEVSVGSPAGKVLKDGDIIRYEKTRGLEEVANEIADKVKPVLIEVRDIISYINNPEGDIKRSLKNVRELTEELHGTREKVDTLLVSSRNDIGAISRNGVTVLNNANEKINALGPTLERVDRSLATVEQNLPPLLQKLDTSLDHVEKTTLQVRKASEKALPGVPRLVNRAEDVMEGADTLMNALKDIWPIKSHVPVPEEKQFVPGDSHD